MLLPLSDDDRKLIQPAYVTWALLILNLVVFGMQLSDPAFTFGYAAIPAEITTGRDFVDLTGIRIAGRPVDDIPNAPGPNPIQLTLLTSMFMHAGILHLGGNMLFLWIFGDNVEHRFGHVPFLAFYLGSGLAAGLAHIATDPDSMIPSLGASGAIAGVLGAYLVLFPRNQVYALVFIWIVTLPAFVVILMWIIAQLVGGFESISETARSNEVAYGAHIGGFVAGVILALFFRQHLQEEPESVFHRHYVADPSVRRWW